MADSSYLNPVGPTSHSPDPEGVLIFRKFLQTSGMIWPHRSQQGLYVMMPDGEFLFGRFAACTNPVGRDVLVKGWRLWEMKNAGKPMSSIPNEPLQPQGDRTGDIRLRVAYRDLPRGNNLRPESKTMKNPF
ncbi:MAG: hypothetical protein AAF226_19775, partial [Verrucomicrobiota bacterium]